MNQTLLQVGFWLGVYYACGLIRDALHWLRHTAPEKVGRWYALRKIEKLAANNEKAQ